MSSTRTFYRTVIQVEVLSEDPYDFVTLGTIAADIRTGECSGSVTTLVENAEVDGPTMAHLLLNQASDPAFFQLDAEGNDLDAESEEK